MVLSFFFFLSLSGILGECSIIDSLPVLLLLLRLLLLLPAHTNSTLYARIDPQWLSELRRL